MTATAPTRRESLPTRPDDARRERWKREDAAEAKEVAARAFAISEKENRAAVEALERKERHKQRKWQEWDGLLASDAFREYLAERDLAITNNARFLPTDIEAEMAAIGAMLMEGEAVEAGLRKLRPRVLWWQRNRLVLLAIANVQKRFRQNRGPSVDLITVTSELRRMGDYNEAGGAGHLATCIKSCPSAANIEGYIEPILECAQLRALCQLADELRTRARREDDADIHRMDALTRIRRAPSYSPRRLLAVIRKACDEIERRYAPDVAAFFEETK